MKSKAYVPKETSIYMRYLFQDKGLRGNELLKRFPKYSKATIYRPLVTATIIDHLLLKLTMLRHLTNASTIKGVQERYPFVTNVTLSGTCVSIGQQSGTFPHPDYGRWLASFLMYLPGVFEEYLI